MNAPTKVENSVKQYVLTLKAGEKRTESVSAKKRTLLSQFILNKKIKTSLIICNQKRSVTATVKFLTKDFAEQVFALSELSKEDITAKISATNKKPLLFVATPAELKKIDNQANISHIIHIDFPTKTKDYLDDLSLALSMKKPAEIWSFVSPEDTKHIQNSLKSEQAHLQLGRLKGHRNVNIGIDFHNEKVVASKDAEKETNEIVVTEVSDEIEVDKKPKRKRPSKSANKKQKKQPNTDEKTPATDTTDENNEQTKTEAVSKARSRPRKTKPDQEQRLPKKRTRRRQADKITEATAPELPVVEEDTSNEVKLDIEVKQMAKPKVRRNPQGRIIGMGEHTPAFMLKEIVFKNSTLETEDE